MQLDSATVHGVFIGALLLVACLPIVGRLARAEVDRRIGNIVYLGLALKLLAAPVHIWVVERFYKGVTDADFFGRGAEQLAPLYRRGNWGYNGRIPGNGFVKIVLAEIYAVIGVNRLAGYFVFSLIGFFGVYFFYRAFRLALPEADHRRYARLVFLMPALVFWTSSVGKEALIVFGLGLCAWGAARLFVQQRGGYLLLGAGIWECALVRPHVALIVFVAVAAGFVMRRSQRSSGFGLARRLIGIGMLAAIGTVLVQVNTQFFSLKSLNGDTVESVLDKNQEHLGANEGNTGQGYGSSQAARKITPGGFPRSLVTILFRPFPYEAKGVPLLASSAQSTLLLLLVAASPRRLWAMIKRSPRQPYVLMCLLFSLIFIYLFASLSNLGIIDRERVQLLPFFFVFLSGPLPRVRRVRLDDDRTGTYTSAGAGGRIPGAGAPFAEAS
jgi:hypothetical protein